MREREKYILTFTASLKNSLLRLCMCQTHWATLRGDRGDGCSQGLRVKGGSPVEGNMVTSDSKRCDDRAWREHESAATLKGAREDL